jgi:hypothetical protein
MARLMECPVWNNNDSHWVVLELTFFSMILAGALKSWWLLFYNYCFPFMQTEHLKSAERYFEIRCFVEIKQSLLQKC